MIPKATEIGTLDGVLSPSISGVWSRFLGSIERKLSRQVFETWFRPIRFDRCDEADRVLAVSVPNRVVRDWVTGNYSDQIASTLTEIDLRGYVLSWSVNENSAEENDPLLHAVSLLDQSPQETAFDASRPAPIPVRSHPGDAAQQAPEDFFLNPKCTFESFVVGSCNQFAHAASLAVADSPGKTYNPLYIYGGVGLGKTHLMHAIGHAIRARNKHLRLCYISAEKFMNELINSIKCDKAQSFREKYRSIDVLLVDDIQFMAGKERTQVEFFHTFNALYESQKQIVISSDCPPREIPTLEERLHSRFEWGLIADIAPPDLETKVAILRRKAEQQGVKLSDDVALLIASRVKNNIRELEGSLIRLVAMSSLRSVPISKELAQDAIRDIADDDNPKRITVEQIKHTVAAFYRLRPDELTSKTNSRRIALPRQVAMYLCKKLTTSSFPEIGREFGGKHHTTVMHSVDKIESLVRTDESFMKLTSDLADRLAR